MKKNIFVSIVVLASLGLAGCMSLKASQKPAPVTHYGAEQGAGSAGVHTVIGNETLYNISQRYKLAMRDIAVANNLQAPFDLQPGQRLRLPPPQEYKTKPGDTVYSVSKLFGVNTSEIAGLNQLRAPYTLEPGRTLRLPSVTRKTAPPHMMMAHAPAHPVSIAPMPTPTPRTASAKPVAIAREELPPPPAQEMQVASIPPSNVLEAPPEYAPEPEAMPRAPEPKSKVTAQTPKRSSAKFLRPVDGSIISGYGTKPNGQHNDGINIQAAQGTPVKAAENGVVVYAGSELKGSGNLILIRHEGRWMTAYAHMDNILIKRGDTIKRGQTIGTVGTTGSVDSPQLHFEVRRGTEAINPKQYMES